MSHIVTIQTKARDPAAIEAACRRLGLGPPTAGTAKLFERSIDGTLIQFPHWQYPVVIDPQSGDVQYDNFEGHWGDIAQLHRFLQAYAVEKTKLEARRKGLTAIEQALPDGSIQVQIIESAD